MAIKMFSGAKDHSGQCADQVAGFNAALCYKLARQELDILIHVKHKHILQLVGVDLSSLSLLLEYAEKRDLQYNLKMFKSAGVRVGIRTVQQVLSQVSSIWSSWNLFVIICVDLKVAAAVSFLHEKEIIHRDLKPDNVLVLSFPSPHQCSNEVQDDVLVKLADYGISRLSGRIGSKDGGEHTPRYTAPELVQSTGRVQYSEKVTSNKYYKELAQLSFCI